MSSVRYLVVLKSHLKLRQATNAHLYGKESCSELSEKYRVPKHLLSGTSTETDSRLRDVVQQKQETVITGNSTECILVKEKRNR